MLENAKVQLRKPLRPLVRLLLKLGLTPNSLTACGVGAAAISSFMIGTQRLGAALIWLTISLLCDLLDGDLARMRARPISRFGAFLDSCSDRLSDALIFGGLLIGRAAYGEGLSHPWIVAWLAALVGGLMVSYTRARAEGLGLTCRVGIADRALRMAILIALLVFGFGPSLWFLLVLAVLSWITVAQRGALVWRETRADQL